MPRGISRTKFYGKKEDDSESSLCSTSEDDIFEPNDIVIPPTDLSGNDETGSSSNDDYDDHEKTESLGPLVGIASEPVYEPSVLTPDVEVFPSISEKTTTSAVSPDNRVVTSESLKKVNVPDSSTMVLRQDTLPISTSSMSSSVSPKQASLAPTSPHNTSLSRQQTDYLVPGPSSGVNQEVEAPQIGASNCTTGPVFPNENQPSPSLLEESKELESCILNPSQEDNNVKPTVQFDSKIKKCESNVEKTYDSEFSSEDDLTINEVFSSKKSVQHANEREKKYAKTQQILPVKAKSVPKTNRVESTKSHAPVLNAMSKSIVKPAAQPDLKNKKRKTNADRSMDSEFSSEDDLTIKEVLSSMKSVQHANERKQKCSKTQQILPVKAKSVPKTNRVESTKSHAPVLNAMSKSIVKPAAQPDLKNKKRKTNADRSMDSEFSSEDDLTIKEVLSSMKSVQHANERKEKCSKIEQISPVKSKPVSIKTNRVESSKNCAPESNAMSKSIEKPTTQCDLKNQKHKSNSEKTKDSNFSSEDDLPLKSKAGDSNARVEPVAVKNNGCNSTGQVTLPNLQGEVAKKTSSRKRTSDTADNQDENDSSLSGFDFPPKKSKDSRLKHSILSSIENIELSPMIINKNSPTVSDDDFELDVSSIVFPSKRNASVSASTPSPCKEGLSSEAELTHKSRVGLSEVFKKLPPKKTAPEQKIGTRNSFARTAKKAANYCEQEDNDENNFDDSASDDDFLYSPEPRSKKNQKKVKAAGASKAQENEDSDLVLSSSSSEDDDNEHEDDDVELIEEEVDDEQSKQRSSKQTKVPEIPYTWCSEDIPEIPIDDPINLDEPDNMNPIDYFLYYFDAEILRLIVDQTNLYSAQRHVDNEPMNLTVQELKVFLGLWIFMGVCSLPSYHDYWSGVTRIPLVADAMSHARFKLIRARLHFIDNTDKDQNDAMAKVRPLLDHMKKKCQQLDQNTSHYSIDESVVRYKGKKAGNLRQYMKNKPHKWGFKAYVLTSSSGIAFDFLVYSGSKTFIVENVEEKNNLGIGGNVVYHLCRSIQDPEKSGVCFDNYFTSLALISLLQSDLGLHSIGTLRSDRAKGCPLSADKVLIKAGRGTSEVHKNNDNVAVVKWADNKCVLLAGNWAGIEPQTSVQRWSKQEKKFIDVNCPRIVKLYNTNMGGVDLLDMLMSMYRLPTRAKRWPLPLVGFLIDLALVNAFLCYRRDKKILDEDADLTIDGSKSFRLKVSSSLIAEETRKRGRPTLESLNVALRVVKSPVIPRPPEEMRRNNGGHLPILNDKKGRCRNCADGYTRWKCSQCELLLCLVPNRNCFAQFHLV